MLLIDLFLLRDTPFRHAIDSPRSPWVVSACLLGIGILLGAAMTVYAIHSGEIGGIPLDPSITADPLMLFLFQSVAGTMIVVLVHIGITLFAWLAAKGIGGPGYMVGLYRMTAYALPLGVPAIPAIARTVSFAEPPTGPLPFDSVALPLSVMGAVLFLAGMFHVFRLSQGKGPRLTILAVALFALFTFVAVFFA